MKIDVRTEGEVCVLSLSGRFTGEEGSPDFRERVTELMDAGERLFLVNMANVPFMDSSGLTEIIACNRMLREHEGVIKLVLPEKLRALFSSVFLHEVFEIHDDLGEALSSFAD